MNCPVCSSDMIRKVGSSEFFYKGYKLVVNNFITLRCDGCGVCIVDNERDQWEKQVNDFHTTIDKLPK